ncbi:MAG: type 1 glutamine amidotransferase [Henriciella sp.]|nr:type 1 glutamine amidotransferase [Henriciella sp.]
MKLTVLETGLPPESLRADWPDYPEMFEALLGPKLPGWSFETLSVAKGEPLVDPASLDAILVTGAAVGVYDDEPWMDPLMDFIRWAAASQTPQVGICFGHQAIAQALGAEVRKSDKGWGIGRHVYDIETRPAWMNGYEQQTFALGVSHQDQVETLPPGAEKVAGNSFCPFAALNYPAASAISFQGHPEYSAAFSCDLYGVRKGTRIASDLVDAAEASFADPIDNDLVGDWIGTFLGSAIKTR